MPDFPSLLLSRDRLLYGLTPDDLANHVKSGALVRVRHGVYIEDPPGGR
ncbi:type IV toxin-antitoxin system AbiEi family antitoxin domain-containing protein [Arthrobacter sp. 9AX]|nr:type IV toxin-antitoxin system AbiEi family antitoxin domain-containing protein [Arthrobacter sp. 9AX]